MSNDDHQYEYDQELLDKMEMDDMKKHCPGCHAWLGDYYMCMYGGKDNCIYVDKVINNDY